MAEHGDPVALKERLDEATMSSIVANENLDSMSKHAKELEQQLATALKDNEFLVKELRAVENHLKNRIDQVEVADAELARYSKIIDAKHEWALSLDKRLTAANDDGRLLATILDALERNEDVFIRECRTPRDDRDGRWLVSQSLTEEFTYIKEMDDR